MTNKTRLDYLQAAKDLTGSTDINILIDAAKKLEAYFNPETNQNFNKPLGTLTEFMSSVKIHHPTKGAIPFSPYEFQTDVANAVYETKTPIVMIKAARQMGMTTTMCAYALYEAVSRSDQSILILAERFLIAQEMMDRIKYMIETSTMSLPHIEEYSKNSIKFSNGSRIFVRAASEHSTRGMSLTHVILENASFIPYGKGDAIWQSFIPCIATGGKIILQSCAMYQKGLFYDFWTGNKQGTTKISVTWDMHPDRDQVWADQMKQTLGQERFKSEYEGEFIPYPENRII